MIKKAKRKWGHLPYHRVGLLHKWRFIEYSFNGENDWITLCGLEYDEYPHPHFTAKGMKCKKCVKTDIGRSKNKGY